MLLTDKQIKDLKEGIDTKIEVCDYLLRTYPIQRIVDDYVELIMKTDINDSKIVVTEEEYQAILSLFKVKGQRLIDGQVVKETRGRKRGFTPNPTFVIKHIGNTDSSNPSNHMVLSPILNYMPNTP